jgi:rare lipoprotein A
MYRCLLRIVAAAAIGAATVAAGAQGTLRVGAPTIIARESGQAAVYSGRHPGHKTTSGERYDPQQLTASHRSLPYGTELMVSNPKTHKSVVVRINDRAALPEGRILDVSPAAARALGMRGAPAAEVTTEVVGSPSKARRI